VLCCLGLDGYQGSVRIQQLSDCFGPLAYPPLPIIQLVGRKEPNAVCQLFVLPWHRLFESQRNCLFIHVMRLSFELGIFRAELAFKYTVSSGAPASKRWAYVSRSQPAQHFNLPDVAETGAIQRVVEILVFVVIVDTRYRQHRPGLHWLKNCRDRCRARCQSIIRPKRTVENQRDPGLCHRHGPGNENSSVRLAANCLLFPAAFGGF